MQEDYCFGIYYFKQAFKNRNINLNLIQKNLYKVKKNKFYAIGKGETIEYKGKINQT